MASPASSSNARSSHCMQDCLPFVSPVADFANFLLNGDASRGYQGLLVRTIDRFFDDKSESGLLAILHRHQVDIEGPLPPLQSLPSSYLHASMRAPGAIFQDEEFESFAVMVGTKFANNTALKQFQSNDSVDCGVIYPTDGTSLERGSFLGENYCFPNKLLEVCVDGDCLANGPMACGGCKVNPHDYGDLVSRWVMSINNNEKLYVPWHLACYYDNFADAVISANSMWNERERWSLDPHPFQYKGYTECTSSVRIEEIGMADAIILPLQRLDPENFQTVADFLNHDWLVKRLQEAYNRGYGDHPLLWYRESKGIRDVESCSRLFQGKGCDDAWHKELFSQEYVFPNNACVYKPPGCDEAYFFPATKDGKECSAFTKDGAKRTARLCAAEKQQDARIAWEQHVVGERTGVQATAARTKAFNATVEMNSGGLRYLDPGRVLAVDKTYTNARSLNKPAEEIWVSDIMFLTLGALAALVLMRTTRVLQVRVAFKS